MITKAEITDMLGPVEIDWTFAEIKVVRGRNRQFRAFVETKVAKRLISPDGKGSGMLSHTSGGTGSTHEAAVLAAIETSLMWMNLLPEVAKARGVDGILNELGPVGLNWGFTLKDSEPIATHGGSVRNTVEVVVKKAAIAYDGKGKGDITRTEDGYCSIKTVGELAPEEEATNQAIKKAMSWLCIISDEQVEPVEVEEPALIMVPLDMPKPKRGRLLSILTMALSTVVVTALILI